MQISRFWFFTRNNISNMFDKSAENLENLQALHTSINKALSAADQASQSGSPVDL